MSNTNYRRAFTMPFTQIPNDVLGNPNIKADTKAIYFYLLSKPDGWDFSSNRIVRDFKENIKLVRRCLNELIDLGYLTRKRQPTGKMEYVIYLTPTEPIRLRDSKAPLSNTEKKSNTKKKTPKRKVSRSRSPSSRESPSQAPDGGMGFVPSSKYNEYAQTFRQGLGTRVRKKPSIRSWASSFRKLVEVDEVDENEMLQVMEWYLSNITRLNELYIPRVFSARKFRDRYDDLYSAMGRVQGNEQEPELPKIPKHMEKLCLELLGDSAEDLHFFCSAVHAFTKKLFLNLKKKNPRSYLFYRYQHHSELSEEIIRRRIGTLQSWNGWDGRVPVVYDPLKNRTDKTQLHKHLSEVLESAEDAKSVVQTIQ